jgi:5-aminolevulinate synthase
MDYEDFFGSKISELQREGRYRYFANLERKVGEFPAANYLGRNAERHPEPRPVTVWCSNDYLGMGQHPDVLNAMTAALVKFGAGAGGTRNISGTHNLHVQLEAELADLHQKEGALVFSSGYLANETALGTLGQLLPNCIIISDECNHASMIQGIRLARCEKVIFRHNDATHLEEILAGLDPDRPKIVAFESVHSMDGDIAPIRTLCEISRRYGAMTFLDETHAVGLYGARGGGVAEQDGILDLVDVIEGGLGKAYGVIGGFVTGSRSVIDAIRSYGAGFIFTTAMPPVVAAGALASVQHLKRSRVERDLMHQRSQQTKRALAAAGIPVIPNPSHIIPVVVGDSLCCRQVADILMDRHNTYIQPINYPTVPRGTERLRITPTPVHTMPMVEALVEALSGVWEELGLPRTLPEEFLRQGCDVRAYYEGGAIPSTVGESALK